MVIPYVPAIEEDGLQPSLTMNDEYRYVDVGEQFRPVIMV